MTHQPEKAETREELLAEISALRRRLRLYESCTDFPTPDAPRGEFLDELREAEQFRRESEEQLRILFENSPVPIIVVDPVDLRFIKFNERALALSGYSREEFERLTVLDLEANLTLEELQVKGQELREKGWHQFETRIRSKNGDLHDLRLTGQLIHIGGRPLLLQIFEDISAYKAMEGELIRAKDAAEEASRAKGEFLANMSHEIRTPLTVVAAAIELLLQMPANPEQRELLEMADSSAGHLQNLIEDILDFSRIEARRLEIHSEDFDLGECLEKAVDLFRMQAKKKGLSLLYERDPATPTLIHGDPNRLSQVLVNLIGNAVKFTQNGTVALRIDRLPESLLFSVRDTGIGIAENECGRLFQSFSQLDGSLTRKYGGTGLGLAISKSLVELMGGTIRVASKEGEGSVFSFTVPLHPMMPSREPSPGGTPAPLAASRPARILLVEDDFKLRTVLSLMLSERQWEVVTADGGDQGVREWMKGVFDLILMDLQMAGMDGLEATRIIRERESGTGARIPIIALTAHVRPEDRETCLAAGMDDFLGKPVKMDVLRALVERHLGENAPRAPGTTSQRSDSPLAMNTQRA